MTKRFFLAALTAVALTMGFTACSDDDENTPSAGDYKLSGNFNISHGAIDSTEINHIIDTYCQALGASADNGEFTIQGKDSADCVSRITTCCEQAETKLAGQTWTGAYKAQVLTDDCKTNIYEHRYGKNAENFVSATIVNYLGPNNDKLLCNSFLKEPSEETVPMNTFVTSFSTQNNGRTGCSGSDWSKRIYHSCPDLNDAYFNTLYLLMHVSDYTLDDVKTMVRNDDARLNELVGDVMVLYFYHGNYPQEFTYNGAKYEVCGGGTMGERAPIDLNYKSGGPYMYLYVSHDVKHFNRVLDGHGSGLYRCNINFGYKDMWGPYNVTSQLVQAVYQDDNGNLSAHDDDGIDLQKGNKDYYMKMRACYIPLSELK